MTISSTVNRVSYNGNGVTTAFSFPYLFYANDDLTVILVDADGIETVQTITTDYTVSGAGVGAGGTVTMVTAPATGEKLVILREVDYDQQDFDPTDNDPFPAGPVEQAIDTIVMMAQQLKEITDRSLKFPRGDSTSLTTQLPPAGDRANKALIFDEDGNVTVSTDDYEDQAAEAAEAAASAAASAAAAASSASSASTSASNAATSETNAAASASSAAASAAAAASTLASALWRGTRRLTSANSPYTVVVSSDPSLSDNGRLLVCDTGSGAIVINLPAIAGNTPFNLGVVKDTADANTVTLSRNGTDTIDGDTTKVLSGNGAGCELIADATATPDEWEVINFGASASSFHAPDIFNGNGTTGPFTLSQDPGSENAIEVFVGALYQPQTKYSLSGTSLTFAVGSEPPAGTANVVVIYKAGVALDIGTVADSSITSAKIADDAVTSAKLADQTGIAFAEGSAPSTPASGLVALYAKSDGHLYSKDDAGVESFLGGIAIGTETWTDTEANCTTSVKLTRFGNLLRVDGVSLFTGVMAGSQFEVTIPAGYTPDSFYVRDNTNGVSVDLGNCTISDYGSAQYFGSVRLIEGNTLRMQVLNVGATYATYAALTATVPMTWANNDRIVWSATYRVSGW